MARQKKSFITSLQENYAGLILGAIIVIILGLLIANFLSRKNEDISDGQQVDLSQQEESKPEEYKVVANDSLSKLADKFYGDMELWSVLARENNIANPNIIFVDSTLTIPSKDRALQLKEQMAQTSYKVAAGDTLFEIAQKMYGDGSKWPLISRANNLGKLPNGNPLVIAESTIKIPR